MEFEYRVVPAPRRLKKKRGVLAEELCADTLTEGINAEARQGWEYLRAETLTVEQPGGWFRRGSVTEETVLVFRRLRATVRLAPVSEEAPAEIEPRVSAEPPRVEPRANRPIGREPEARSPRVIMREPEVGRSRRAPEEEGEGGPSLLRPVPRTRPPEN